MDYFLNPPVNKDFTDRLPTMNISYERSLKLKQFKGTPSNSIHFLQASYSLKLKYYWQFKVLNVSHTF